jgi:hypothetical protein
MSEDRWICRECSSVCGDKELLRAPNPFAPAEEIVGCPICEEVNAMVGACDFGGCVREASTGSPTADGYVRRCWEHSPLNKAFAA